jgi:hypothetical protein
MPKKSPYLFRVKKGMRLDKYPPKGRKLLKIVTEIADILWITSQKLSHDLAHESAPGKITAKSLGHCVAGKNRVWYEPKSVIKWWKDRHQTQQTQS